MNNILKKEFVIPVSRCLFTGELSVPGLLAQFMDMASEHGSEMGLGHEELKARGLMWIVSRTKLVIHRLPGMLERVTAKSWPGAAGNIRCPRYYTLHDAAGGLLAEGRNEWSILETGSMKPFRLSGIYPDMQFLEQTAADAAFARPDADFSAAEELELYRVRPTDIDTSMHMNNVAYLAAAYGALPFGRAAALKVREVDIGYRAQCYEGDRLSIRMRESGNGLEMGLIREDGGTAAVIALSC